MPAHQIILRYLAQGQLESDQEKNLPRTRMLYIAFKNVAWMSCWIPD